MEAAGVLPWPGTGGHYRKFTNAQFASLGRQTYPTLPASQNATALVLTIYDWTTPDYRRSNFLITAHNNITAFGELMLYQSPTRGPHIPRIFALYGSTDSVVLSELQSQWTTVKRWCNSEATVLQFALLNLPEVKYSQGPRILYRGDGRDASHFCNQFTSQFGLSIDACVSKVFAPTSTVTVQTFWSSSPSPSVVTHFSSNVIFNILPNTDPSVRSSWRSRPITPFSVDPSLIEYLFPSGSSYYVESAKCTIDPNDNENFWNITLREINPTVSVFPAAKPSIVQCISLSTSVRKMKTLTEFSSI
jgi:hypothetical protein